MHSLVQAQLPYREARAGPERTNRLPSTSWPVGDTRTSLSLNNRHFRSPISQMNKKRDYDYDTSLIAIDIHYSRTQLALPNRRHTSRPSAHSVCTTTQRLEVPLQNHPRNDTRDSCRVYPKPVIYPKHDKSSFSSMDRVLLQYCIPCTAVPNLQCHLPAQAIPWSLDAKLLLISSLT